MQTAQEVRAITKENLLRPAGWQVTAPSKAGVVTLAPAPGGISTTDDKPNNNVVEHKEIDVDIAKGEVITLKL